METEVQHLIGELMYRVGVLQGKVDAQNAEMERLINELEQSKEKTRTDNGQELRDGVREV